jgi:outer membrane protein assembly factor BamB/serine/threonine protein kinase
VSDPYATQGSQIIGEYRLVQKLGRGGFGTVYLAEHIHERARVAIKILHVPLVKPEDFRGFIKEAGTMTLLRHPHIIPLLYFNLSGEGFPFMVMEYASQGTLRDRHPTGSQVRLASIVEYVEQIASALQYAHDRRIIHRDVKPENMLLRADGTLLLSDFGIAKIMEQSALMSVQTQVGTPVYMAPEQHLGYPCFASDQYALAVVVYEWISGTRPFRGTSFGLAVQHMTASPSSLLNQLPTLPPPIEQVIFKALSKTPEQRFATVQEFAAAFHAAAQEANFSGVYTRRPVLEETPLQEAMSQLPITSISRHTESAINTSSVPQHPLTDEPIESEPAINTPLTPRPPLTNEPIKPDPKINIPSVLPTPYADQSIEPDAQISQSPAQVNNPPSSNRPYATNSSTHNPALSPVIAAGTPSRAVRVFRRLSPLRRNLLLISSGLLVGCIVLALVINIIGVSLQHTPKNNNTVPGHSSHNEPVLDTSTASRLVEKWTFQTEGPVESSPAVVGGVVYVGSIDNNVYALDARSGRKKWVFPTGGRVSSSPAVVDGVIYIGSDDSNVYAIDAQLGKQKWAFPTEDSVSSPPAVVDGVVYVGSQDGNVYAIDAQSGKQKWAFQTGNIVHSSSLGPPPGPPPRPSSPVVVGGVVYISTTDHNVYAIDAQLGKKKWAFPTGSSVNSSPAVVDGLVYVGSFDRNVYAIDVQSAEKKWTFQTRNSLSSSSSGPPPPPVSSSPAVVGGIVYVGATDHNVYALDAQSGEKKWAFRTGDIVVSSPAIANGLVYVGSFDRNVYAIDAQSGEKKWAFRTGDIVHSSPVVVDGVVYVGSFDGDVYAFGLPATTP